MSSIYDSESDRTIPLSSVHARRRDNQKTGISLSDLEEVFANVLDKKVTLKIERLQKSIDRMVDQFEGVKNGEAEDSALRVTTDPSSSDIALASVKLYPEDYYIYICSMIEEKLGVERKKVLEQIKKLKLKGDQRYHKSIATGRKSGVQKYSDAALAKIKEALEQVD